MSTMEVILAIIGLIFAVTFVVAFILGIAYSVRDMVNAHEKYSSKGHPILATLWLLYGLGFLASVCLLLFYQPEVSNYFRANDPYWLMTIGSVAVVIAIPILLAWVGERAHRGKPPDGDQREM